MIGARMEGMQSSPVQCIRGCDVAHMAEAMTFRTNAEQQARDFQTDEYRNRVANIFPIAMPESTSLEQRVRGAHANGTDR